MILTGAKSISDIRKKITSTHEMISTSYHEAGHTVYSLLCGMMVSSVYIFENKRNKRIEGACLYHMKELHTISDRELLNFMVHSEIGIRYAGLTSEKYFFKITSGSDKFPKFLKDGSSDDTLKASAIIKEFNVAPPGKKRYDFKKRKINQVLKDLAIYWDDVAIIAHALFSKKKLLFADIKKLFLNKSPNKKFWREQFKIISFVYENNLSLDDKELKIILRPEKDR